MRRALAATIAATTIALTSSPANATEPAAGPPELVACRADLEDWQRRALNLGRYIVYLEREFRFETLAHRYAIDRKNDRIERLLERIERLR